jgi:hypothetical protein
MRHPAMATKAPTALNTAPPIVDGMTGRNPETLDQTPPRVVPAAPMAAMVTSCDRLAGGSGALSRSLLWRCSDCGGGALEVDVGDPSVRPSPLQPAAARARASTCAALSRLPFRLAVSSSIAFFGAVYSAILSRAPSAADCAMACSALPLAAFAAAMPCPTPAPACWSPCRISSLVDN